jgi:hypothetical protein
VWVHSGGIKAKNGIDGMKLSLNVGGGRLEVAVIKATELIENHCRYWLLSKSRSVSQGKGKNVLLLDV